MEDFPVIYASSFANHNDDPNGVQNGQRYKKKKLKNFNDKMDPHYQNSNINMAHIKYPGYDYGHYHNHNGNGNGNPSSQTIIADERSKLNNNPNNMAPDVNHFDLNNKLMAVIWDDDHHHNNPPSNNMNHVSNNNHKYTEWKPDFNNQPPNNDSQKKSSFFHLENAHQDKFNSNQNKSTILTNNHHFHLQPPLLSDNFASLSRFSFDNKSSILHRFDNVPPKSSDSIQVMINGNDKNQQQQQQWSTKSKSHSHHQRLKSPVIKIASDDNNDGGGGAGQGIELKNYFDSNVGTYDRNKAYEYLFTMMNEDDGDQPRRPPNQSSKGRYFKKDY